MPSFGVCASPETSAALRAAGWDFVEGNIQGLFQPLAPDEQWTAAQSVRQSVLPMPAANSLLPGKLKVTGPDVDSGALRAYLGNALRRARQCGTSVLVFGSGAARKIPEGFDRDRARRQILDFLGMAAPLAAEQGVTLVVEPLNRKETNVINSVAEAMEYVREIGHPGFQCLVDSYHFWLEDEPLTNLEAAMPWIRHVHLADKEGRVAPGQSGTSDYRPFFRVLKAGGYDRLISIECTVKDAPASYPTVLQYIKQAWAEA